MLHRQNIALLIQKRVFAAQNLRFTNTFDARNTKIMNAKKS